MGALSIIKSYRYFNNKEKVVIFKTHFLNLFKRQPFNNPDIFNEFVRIVGYLNSGIRILSFIDSNFLIQYKINGVITKSFLRNKSSDFDAFRGVILWNEYSSVLGCNAYNVKYIIDAGANIGFTSLYFNRHFPNANIIAIEPDNNNFISLKKNIEINQIHKIFATKRALWIDNDNLEISNDFADGREWSLQVKKVVNSMNQKVEGITLNQIVKFIIFHTLIF